MSIIAVAKNVIAGAPTNFSKKDFFDELQKRSAAIRQKGESEAQAFARYVETVPEGGLLLRAHKLAREDADLADLADFRPRPAPMTQAVSPSYERLQRLAADLRARRSDNGIRMTPEEAFAEVYRDPQNGPLVEEDRAYNRNRSLASAPSPVYGHRPGWEPASARNADWDPTDGRDAAHRATPAFRKIAKKAAKLRKKHPGLTAEQAFAKIYESPKEVRKRLAG